MSIVTNRSNVYIMSPATKYGDISADWGPFMENDFTIYIKSKILVDRIEKKSHPFMLSRNGKHAGLSTYKDDESNMHATFTYWFWQLNPIKGPSGEIEYNNPIPIQKRISYCLPPEEKNQFNEYIIKCSHKQQKMWFYINDVLIGEIDYNGLDKCSYKESYMWLGCGNMVTENEDHKNVGEYEHDLFFCLDKNISLDDIKDLKKNYRTKYIKDYFGFPILNDQTPHKDNIYFFLDFDQKTDYKIWNLCFNGCYTNFYIENNTMF